MPTNQKLLNLVGIHVMFTLEMAFALDLWP